MNKRTVAIKGSCIVKLFIQLNSPHCNKFLKPSCCGEVCFSNDVLINESFPYRVKTKSFSRGE